MVQPTIEPRVRRPTVTVEPEELTPDQKLRVLLEARPMLEAAHRKGVWGGLILGAFLTVMVLWGLGWTIRSLMCP